jgi:hypothetical protein
MSVHATKDKSGHCPRCREDVREVRPWPHWRKVRYGYFGVLGCALFGTPVLLCDGFVLIPTLMLFMAAIGPLNSLVAKPSTCAQCGGPTEPLRHLRVVSSKRGVAPSFFRSLRKHKVVSAAKGQLVRLRQKNVRDGNRGPDQHENEAAP